MTAAEGALASPTTPVKDREAPRDLPSGWRVVAAKEFADHLHSLRFGILFVVLGLAAVVPLYFVASTLRTVAEQASEARSIFLALFVFNAQPASGFTIPAVYGFVGIVAPLLGVAFGFDAINAERSDGTLPRLLSQPIYRDHVIIGKFVAGLAVIMLVLVSVVVLISGFGIVRLGIVPDAQAILRVVAWLGFTIIWVSLWLAFGLLLSVVIRRAATAALAGFGVWVLLQVFGQLIVGLVAGVIAPLASATSDQSYLDLKNLSDGINRLLPLTLYQEGSSVLLNPTKVTVGQLAPTLGQVAQQQQQFPSLLALDQSLLLVWPHIAVLVILTLGCFALAFVKFMRQEVRA
jgi:ABC-2 type transport system permease protein